MSNTCDFVLSESIYDYSFNQSDSKTDDVDKKGTYELEGSSSKDAGKIFEMEIHNFIKIT